MISVIMRLLLIAVPIAIALTLISIWLWPARSSETPVVLQDELCLDADVREMVRSIMLAALDEGLKKHTVQMYDVWMRDDRDQPTRAITGMRSTIAAYARARNAAVNWSPPRCP
jgi:hypothetical protein